MKTKEHLLPDSTVALSLLQSSVQAAAPRRVQAAPEQRGTKGDGKGQAGGQMWSKE